MIKKSKGIGVVILILVIIVILIVYITVIERKLVVAKEYKIEINNSDENKIKIVQFTDTQLGEYYSIKDFKKAVNKINNLKPDIVIFTGDLIDNFSKYEDREKVSEVLEGIRANIGKYAVYGNHDYGGGAIRNYKTIMENGGFILLRNSNEIIEYKGKKINIFGCDDALFGKYNVEETIRGIEENNINILAVHEPDISEKFKEYPIDLILSGHSHGGQIYLPFIGPLKKNILSKKYNRGMYELENKKNTKLYVNTGLGNTKIPFRFLTIPEVVAFNISY
ncbi:MAG: metallophosphoesterase [Clostridium sp.]